MMKKIFLKVITSRYEQEVRFVSNASRITFINAGTEAAIINSNIFLSPGERISFGEVIPDAEFDQTFSIEFLASPTILEVVEEFAKTKIQQL